MARRSCPSKLAQAVSLSIATVWAATNVYVFGMAAIGVAHIGYEYIRSVIATGVL